MPFEVEGTAVEISWGRKKFDSLEELTELVGDETMWEAEGSGKSQSFKASPILFLKPPIHRIWYLYKNTKINPWYYWLLFSQNHISHSEVLLKIRFTNKNNSSFNTVSMCWSSKHVLCVCVAFCLFVKNKTKHWNYVLRKALWVPKPYIIVVGMLFCIWLWPHRL